MNKKNLAVQLVKFGLSGLINTAIDFIILNTCIQITGITSGIFLILFNTISFTSALINSYFLNKNWTFPNREKKKTFLRFLFVNLFSLIINNIIVYCITSFTTLFFSIPASLLVNLAKVTATLVSMVCNFLGYKYLVFNHSSG